MTLDEENIHSLAASYALDALDDVERRRFETHLASGCATCNEEVVGFLNVAAALGSADEAPVSDELRAAVMAVPDTVRQVGPRMRPTRRRDVARQLSLVAAATLAIATAGLTAVVLDQQRSIDGLEQDAAVATSVIEALEQDAAVAAVLQQPDATVSFGETATGVVRVVSSQGAGQAVLVAAGFEQLPEDQTYQLWLIDAEGATSAGFLGVEEDGSAEQVLAGSPTGVAAVGISIEPAGGSDAPTTTPIAVVELG